MESSRIYNRVPRIIFIYWIIKIASTTLGETGADMFSMTMDIGYSVTMGIFFGLFLLFLGLKLWIRKYEPILYWLLFTSSAILGTVISDFIDRTLGLGYTFGSSILLALLLLTLFIWKKQEKSISVEKIFTLKAELFYWIAFLIANTLGTAMGDFLADELELGFLVSAGIISAILVAVTLLYFYTKISPVIIFWIAFVMTRPFGATFGDLLTKPVSEGGLNFGTIGSSIVFFIILCLAVVKESKLEKVRNLA